MEHFAVDVQKCSGCGRCAAVCPAGIIQQPAPKIPPTTGANANLCVSCGHCMAICSQRALSLNNMDASQLVPAVTYTEQTRLSLANLVRGRRSVREFSKEEVAQSLLESLIDSARYSPTGGNAQMIKWIVLRGSAAITQVTALSIEWFKQQPPSPIAELRSFYEGILHAHEAGLDPICRKATALVVTCSGPWAMSGATDCAVALGYFDLLATASGLGTCWGGLVAMASQYQPLREYLGIPADHQMQGAMMVGHPVYRYPYVPLRKPAQIMWRE